MSENHFGFQVPNLDDTTCNPKEYLDTASVLENLSKYLRHKAAAQIARKRGNMTTAIMNDQKCDALFKKLPDWARW